MDVTVLIPYRYKDDWRAALHLATRAGWAESGIPFVVGYDDPGEPFCLSRAVNRGVLEVQTEGVVIFGADHLPDPARVLYVGQQLEDHPWVGLYEATSVLTESCTRRMLAEGIDRHAVERLATVPFCTGIMAMRTEVLLDVPMDERFKGWGCEDTAHRLALETLYGPPGDARGELFALWHEHAGDEHFSTNAGLLGGYIAAEGNPDKMREVVALGR